MKPTIFAVASALAFLAGCAGPATPPADSTPTTRKATMTNLDPKTRVTALLTSIETGDPGPIAFIDPHRYTQHNLSAADGLAGFGALMQQIPKGSARAKTVRVYRDGDFVFAHTDYDFFGPKVGFDIFRFENGKIVEHWDNLQEKPHQPNPSGHTMLDGPTEATRLERTADNKARVAAFLDDILVHGRMDKLGTYIDGEHYTQHNPAIGDGLSGLGTALAEMAKHGVTMKYDKVHRVLGEGNFVLAVSEGTFGGKPTAFYDLFRVEDGKLVEHWDTIETIPPRGEWKNPNGKF